MPIMFKNCIVAIVSGLLITSVVITGSLVWAAQIAIAQPLASADTQAAPAPPAQVPIQVGDKLKISFFETLDLAAKQAGASPQAALRTFYRRMDLSGEYTVEQDGAISIPILGRLEIAQRDLDNVRTLIAAAFTAAIGQSANLDVKIVERPPVYVVGPVKRPGAYKYVPGMIVLNAIALAGGLDRGNGNLAGAIEGAREMERMRTTTLRLNQLLARRARLEAERSGGSMLRVPVQLTTLADERAARSFVVTEQMILNAERARRHQQNSDIALKVAAARSEVEALKRKIDQVDVQADLRNERLHDMQKLKNRGFATSNPVLVLQTELADIAARRQDAAVALTQAEARLAEAELGDQRLSLEHSAKLATQLASIDQEIAAAQEAIASARALATALHRPTAGPHGYEIVRQTQHGAKTFAATEISPLLPGDILKVDAGAPDLPSPSAAPGLPAEQKTLFTPTAASRERAALAGER